MGKTTKFVRKKLKITGVGGLLQEASQLRKGNTEGQWDLNLLQLDFIS
jgi:hypothetical protein